MPLSNSTHGSGCVKSENLPHASEGIVQVQATIPGLQKFTRLRMNIDFSSSRSFAVGLRIF